MKRMLAICLGLSLSAGIAVASPYALPHFEINFNADTVGSAPSTMTSASLSLTEVNTKPTSRTATTVVSQYVTTGDTLADQPAYIDYSAGGATTPRILGAFRTLPGTSLSNYQFESDVLLDIASDHNALSIYFNNTSGVLIGGLRLSSATNGTIALFSGTTTLSINDQWAVKETFRMGLILDIDNAQMHALINGSIVGTVDIPADHLPGEGRKLGEWDFRNISTSARWQGAVDNIVGTTNVIPEPGTLLLAGAGLLALGVLRRRR